MLKIKDNVDLQELKIKYGLAYDNDSDYMNLISNSNNINEFIMNILNKIKENSYNKKIEWKIELEALSITINGEEIDILKSLNENKVFKM